MNELSCGLVDNSNLKHLLLRCSVRHESLIFAGAIQSTECNNNYYFLDTMWGRLTK